MSRYAYSSLDDAFQPLNPQQQKKIIYQENNNNNNNNNNMKNMWEKRDSSEIYDRMSQGQELPPYCAKENDKFKEFQKDREKYLQSIDDRPRAQLSNDYQDIELGMYNLKNSSNALVKVPNSQKIFLQKRLEELEHELKKYQFLLRVFDEEEKGKRIPKLMDEEMNIESFSNLSPKDHSKDDMIDLIILLAIGLLIIFVLDSVFKMGKSTPRK